MTPLTLVVSSDGKDPTLLLSSIISSPSLLLLPMNLLSVPPSKGDPSNGPAYSPEDGKDDSNPSSNSPGRSGSGGLEFESSLPSSEYADRSEKLHPDDIATILTLTNVKSIPLNQAGGDFEGENSRSCLSSIYQLKLPNKGSCIR